MTNLLEFREELQAGWLGRGFTRIIRYIVHAWRCNFNRRERYWSSTGAGLFVSEKALLLVSGAHLLAVMDIIQLTNNWLSILLRSRF